MSIKELVSGQDRDLEILRPTPNFVPKISLLPVRQRLDLETAESSPVVSYFQNAVVGLREIGTTATKGIMER